MFAFSVKVQLLLASKTSQESAVCATQFCLSVIVMHCVKSVTD